MRNFFSSSKFRIALSVLTALMLGIFIAAVSDSGSSPLSSAAGTVMAPLDGLASQLAKTLKTFNAKFVSADYYRQQSEELSSELESCREQMADYENLKYKLGAYEAFLDVKEKNPDFKFIPAAVIMRDTSDISGSFTVNAGKNDGVEINDPVICGSVLVGVVRELTERSCTVYTLFNPAVSVGTYEIRTREDCYIEYDSPLASKGLLKLSGLSRSTPVVSGGIVCTSGIGGIYPRDLIIGTVTEVIDDATAVTAYAEVRPDIDPASISDVFIITEFEGE